MAFNNCPFKSQCVYQIFMIIVKIKNENFRVLDYNLKTVIYCSVTLAPSNIQSPFDV